MGTLDELKYFLDNFETAPNFAEMPRHTLRDKGADGPTGAHFIEEVHTPFNLAYISITTGTTAFQNITGIPHSELASRIEAGRRALDTAGIKPGDKILITYPPLVNVFCKDALDEYDVLFMERSCRDAFLLALCKEKPRAVIGESSFLRASLEDAVKLGLLDDLPKGTIFLAAGTPLDLELPELVSKQKLGEVHDLYGCQEFGWLALDGAPLRGDISLVPSEEKDGYFHFIVGGLATGDCFPVSENGHVNGGDLITYSRLRTKSEPEGMITHTTAKGEETVYRLAKTILRIKGRVIRVSPGLKTGADETRIVYDSFEIKGPEKTVMFDALLDAQMQYQSQNKKDLTWVKER
ncbi:MAG: acyl carrier protein [Defluviitaleaceae bacterium]|nr:acyl carrier protein [Defluviitaleaceae bacterium]